MHDQVVYLQPGGKTQCTIERVKMVPFTQNYAQLVEAIRRIFGLHSISFYLLAMDGKAKRSGEVEHKW